MTNELDKFICNIELPATALKLRQMRIQKGLTIEELANLSSINSHDLMSFELGKVQPSKLKLKRMLKILN